MDNRRNEPRVASYARVFLTEQQVVGHLRDLSREGCRISILDAPSLNRGDELDVIIVPNEDLGLPRIPANLTIRWVQADRPALSIGGRFSMIPAEYTEAWERLVDYFTNTEAP
jgi:hypothetical protein